MTDFLLNVPIVRALVTRLGTDMPTELAARRAAITASYPAEVTDSAVLRDPQQILPFAPPPSLLTVFPTLGIVDAESMIVDDTGASATGVHDLGIVVYLSSPDQQSLVWGLRHQLGAVAKSVLRDRVLLDASNATASWGVTASAIRWGDTLSDEGSPRTLMSWATFVARFRREEIG